MATRELTLEEKLQRFVTRWQGYSGSEQQGAQSFLRDLLECFDIFYPDPGTIFEQHPVKPVEQSSSALFADAPRGGRTASRPAVTTERMDMYIPKICVWEMKGPAEDLARHHTQVLGYWARTRPRYMVLCNFHDFWLYDTDVEGGQNDPAQRFTLAELPSHGRALLFLRGEEAYFAQRSATVTREAAEYVGNVLRELVRASGNALENRPRYSKFTLECVFAMFAEDAGLLPTKPFTQAMKAAQLSGSLAPVYDLFDDLGRAEDDDRSLAVPYVNGPLFDRRHPKFPVAKSLLATLYTAAEKYDWQAVRPEVFGSIFERALLADERHAAGAHFTSEQDIMKIVGPTVVRPWRERIAACKTRKDAEALIERMRHYHILDPACGSGNFLYVAYREMKRLEAALRNKHQDNWRAKEKKRWNEQSPAPPGPYFSIRQLHGYDKLEEAVQLTRVVLWIGEHLANLELNLGESTLPLSSLEENILRADALLAEEHGLPPRTHEGRAAVPGRSGDVGDAHGRPAGGPWAAPKSGRGGPPSEEEVGAASSRSSNSGKDAAATHLRAAWFSPPDDGVSELAIIGNPPFMGRHKMRLTLTDEYVDQLHAAYPDNRNADLVSYWYPQALSTLRPGERAGFVSSNSIAQNESREASLDRIVAAGGTLHDAWKSYPWPGEAAVHVSIVNWIMGKYEGAKYLSDRPTIYISPALDSEQGTSSISEIIANRDLSFKGIEPGNIEFVIDEETKNRLISEDRNSKDVIKPLLIGRDVNRNIDQSASRWIIDFSDMTMETAQRYRACFVYVQQVVYPKKTSDGDRKLEYHKNLWWLFHRTRPEMRKALLGLETYICTPRTSPHVIFIKIDGKVLPDNSLVVLALPTDYHFGILQSRIHEVWAWARGSTLKGDLRYTNTTIFETFPFPLHPKTWRGARGVKGLPTARDLYEPREVPDTREARLLEAVARELYEKRQAACRSLNLGLTKLYNLIKGKTPIPGRGGFQPPINQRQDAAATNQRQDAAATGERPETAALQAGNIAAIITELQELHERLNDAVNKCYGWPSGTWRDDNEVLTRLLELNRELTE